MNNALRTFVEEIFSTSKLNRLPVEMGGGRIFSPPLLGVARGDDPIFDKFKEVVHPRHLPPAEMWNSSGLPEAPDRGARLRAVSIIFPFDGLIRQAGKESREMPPEVYCLARNWANAFQREALQRTVTFFEDKGFRAVAGSLSPAYELLAKEAPRIASTWSERHLAFAAGLGSFSLHEAFISEAGCNIRLGSVLTDAPLEVTPRPSGEPYRNCLHYSKDTCRECVKRCPTGALSEAGHDKVKCYLYGRVVEKEMNRRLEGRLKPHRRMIDGKEQISYPVGCALCQFGVPCMDKNPMRER